MTELTSAVDVVERLRTALEVALDDGRMHYVVQVFHHDLEQVLAALATAERAAAEQLDDAMRSADEIERLRGELATAEQRNDWWREIAAVVEQRAATAERERDEAREKLALAVKIANEAREEWDMAPNGMRAGKILIALAGGCKGYRADIDAIHAALKSDAGKDSGERP